MLLPIVPVQTVTAAQLFSSSLDHQWQAIAHKHHCELSLNLAEYGVARFVAAPHQALAFELQARRDLAATDFTVHQVAPPWHPSADRQPMLLGPARHFQGGGAVTRAPLAQTMLMALRDGYDLRLQGPAVFGGDHLSLLLRGKDIRAALDDFSLCAHTDVLVSWQAMSRTRVSFEVDRHELAEADQTALRALAQYIQADPSISTVYVDGHTDASGGERGNRLLAKRRAESVARYLRGAGITDRQVVVRYHGANYPVADNDTAAGKALNRRATVRLERAGEQLAGP